MSEPYAVPQEPVKLLVDGVHSVFLEPKRFSSGSVGWYGSTKLEVDGARVQCSFSMVVVGSKPEQPPGAYSDKVPVPAPRKPRKPAKPSANGEVVQTTLDDVKPAKA